MFAIGHGSQPGQEKFWHFFMLCGSCSGTCWCTSVSTCPLSPCCLPLSQFISPLFFRVVYQLICLQPIWHFLMLRRAQGQIPFCSLPCLRFWIGSLCNRFIFLHFTTAILCSSVELWFVRIPFPWDVNFVLFLQFLSIEIRIWNVNAVFSKPS